jgi:hypothetical protein
MGYGKAIASYVTIFHPFDAGLTGFELATRGGAMYGVRSGCWLWHLGQSHMCGPAGRTHSIQGKRPSVG